LDIVACLKLVARVAEIVSPKISLRVITEDPADDRVLECAVAGRADLIVSGDRHLQKLESFRDIGIVRPSDFLRTLGL
jgi:predicted nucleic acid-binding protein